jgi:RNA polymerase sigma factor (sigma-70 family)
MPAELIPRLIGRLRRSAPADPATDAALLERFLTARDGAAFAALVRRHAPMVMGVCRRIVGNEADAEDACQATFLVLVRKAATIRPRGMVGGWLHGVARNVARRARLMAARRRRHEAEARVLPRPPGFDAELRELIDRELDRLPTRCKAAVVLCDLEGLTREEAARQLGWPAGTVAGRLARGRRLLAGRLTRAGLAGSLAAPSALIGADPGAAAPAGLLEHAVTWSKGGHPPAAPTVVALAQEVLRTMTLQRLCAHAAGVVLTAGLVLAGLAALPAATAQAPPQAPKASPPAPGRGADESITIQKLPPVVVKTIPVSGADDVDPGLSEIKVTYSKDMDSGYSWTQLSDDTFPKTTADKPYYEKDKRTCVLKVKLEPGKTYAIWLNSDKFDNFKDADGRPAVPYLLVFKTKKAD